MSLTGTGTDSSIGINGKIGINNIDEANLSDDTRPRWDQRPLAPSTTGDSLALSRAKTTEYTESMYETVYEYDEDGVAVPTQQKKKKTTSPSVYSYNSARDLSQFIKDSYGRQVVRRNPSY